MGVSSISEAHDHSKVHVEVLAGRSQSKEQELHIVNTFEWINYNGSTVPAGNY